jgi:DNA polymerase IV
MRLRTLWRVTVERHRVYAHLDMDAFYVSVELQRRPELRGLPVVVAGSGPRAVVTTASYEARRFGVFSATPAERARRLCPDAIFVTPDFEHYRARSRDVMAVLRSHVERVEVVGLDEAYLDLTALDRYRSAARRIKDAVRTETGLTCSVGLGPNKLVAKVASDAEKPDGFVELTAEDARIRFAEASPGLVPGIGPKTVARLGQLGIATLGRLGTTSDAQLSEWFGTRLGPHLGALARFEDERLIETVRVAKSESRETTFDRDLNGLPQLEPVLERLTSELCETLARAERRGRTIGIKVRFDDFTTVTRARSLDAAVNEAEAVGPVALDLLMRLDPARPVRLLGVRVAGLDEESAQAVADDQLTLSL